MLERDELWSFVVRRTDKRWIWLAQCRRTRQIVAYCTGRRERRDRQPRRGVLPPPVGARPPAYKGWLCYTDFWAAYAEVLPAEQYRATGKCAGQTCHVAVQQRAAPAVRSSGASHALVLEERRDARGLPAPVLAPAHPAEQAAAQENQTLLSHYQVIDGVNWEIRIKEAGEHESVIYTLTIGGREILDFDEYPPFWKRPPAFD